MNNVLLMAWITFKDSIRSKALYSIFFFGLSLFFANIIITGMFSWELGKVAVDVGLAVVSLSGLAIIFFFSIHIVTSDLERKTIYLVLSKPVNKLQYILGKYAGLSLIILVSSFVLGVCSTVSVKLAMMGAEGFIPPQFSWSTFFSALLFITICLLLIQAIAFLCICVTTHPFTAILLCLMVYFIGENLEKVTHIILRGKMFPPDAFFIKMLKVMGWILPNLAAFDLKTAAAYGLPLDGAYLFSTAVYGAAYTAICLVISVMIFQKRELG